MAALFKVVNCVDAWKAASGHLLANGGSDTNVMVEISDPMHLGGDWLTRFDPREVREKADRIRDVMNTIFPQKTWDNSADRAAFYTRYKKAHRRGRIKRWGTYFMRLINFGESHENQLENIVAALSGGWANNPKAAMTIHLSSAETDTLRPLGAPCWHFAEVLCPQKDVVELVAVYRNHDYFNKALGNFIGLSRLLRFIADETGRKPGRLTCHSVRGYFEGSKQDLQALLAK